MTRKSFAWPLLLVAGVLFLGVLSFYRTSPAAPSGTKQPFANAVAQRQEMIEELKEISRLLREQNELLRSGRVKVKVTPPQQN